MENKLLKSLFVTHDIGLYGASRSLQTFLRNYKGSETNLVVNKRLIRSNDLSRIRADFGDRINEIKEFTLPFDPCHMTRGSGSFLDRAKYLKWRGNREKFYEWAAKEQFDFIHLNSLVLHQMLTEDLPFFIHIREIYDHTNDEVFESLPKALGVIFIDEATREPFKHLRLKNSMVLNNPFDMTGLNDKVVHVPQNGVDVTKTIFSLIGAISENKGTAFIIESFKQVKNEQIQLLIVGSGEPVDVKYCRNLAAEDPRIIFYGEEPDILNVYAISDYVLRGEPYACIGRTIYEGLFAGCHVIVPGEEKDNAKVFEYEKFKNNISFYSPREVTPLMETISRLGGKKIVNKKFSSNIDQHIQVFQDFVLNSLKKASFLEGEVSASDVKL